MSNHTPGPWTFNGSYSIMGALQEGSVKRDCVPVLPLVATVAARYEKKANARIIAAAPELLEACEVVLAVLKQAITKAKGGV